MLDLDSVLAAVRAVRDPLERAASAHALRVALLPVRDEAITAAVRLQEESGIDVVTDGEFRRRDFRTGFVEAVDGLTMRRAFWRVRPRAVRPGHQDRGARPGQQQDRGAGGRRRAEAADR